MTTDSYFVLLTEDAERQRLFYLQLGTSQIPLVVQGDPILLRLVALDQDFHIYRVSPGTAVAELALVNEARELRRGMAQQAVVLDDDFSWDIQQAVCQGSFYHPRRRLDAEVA